MKIVLNIYGYQCHASKILLISYLFIHEKFVFCFNFTQGKWVSNKLVHHAPPCHLSAPGGERPGESSPAVPCPRQHCGQQRCY